MTQIVKLENRATIELEPLPPHNFDANFHKPSHFPSSDYYWKKGECWITMMWRREKLGLKFENVGTVDKPRVKVSVFSSRKLSKESMIDLIPEIRWRFNFDQDISQFCRKFEDDKFLGPIIKKWRGMKPVAANSLYETLVIYIVLQNATVRRSVQMLENLFGEFGNKLEFDSKRLSSYWLPTQIAESTDQVLRDLKMGYRARFLMRLSQQFASGEIDELALRQMSKDEIKTELLSLYGVGPVTAEGLLFEHYYFCDRSLERIPPWDQKILSRIMFGKKLVSVERIARFFRENYSGWEKLACHYIWEDIFWKRKHEQIDWLEEEIRL